MAKERFKIILKQGNSKKAGTFVQGLDKRFGKWCRFIYSTNIVVQRSTFDPARPGSALRKLIVMAELALESLEHEGRPVSSETMKHRLDLIRHQIGWAGNELSIWDAHKKKVDYYSLPDGFNQQALEESLQQELQKSKPEFKKVIDSVLSNGKDQIFGFWQSILTGETKARSGNKLRKSTIGVKRQTMMLVKEYSPQASFQMMDMSFYNGFTTWLAGPTEVKRKTKDGKDKIETMEFDANTIGKHIRQLKAVLHLAFRNELMTHDRFRFWPVIQEKNEVVTLTKDELLKINNLKEINNQKLTGTLEDVRDIFILSCFLGPRISDFKNFKKESLSIEAGVMFFSYVQEKTSASCKIPVHPIARAILDKRNGEFPRMISEQNFRYHLKDICKAAELNDRVVIKVRDGKPEYKKKWEAISPHSARRSFATSLFYGWFNRPLPSSYCMLYTGHSSEKSFLLYINAKAKEVNEKALEYFDFRPSMKVG